MWKWEAKEGCQGPYIRVALATIFIPSSHGSSLWDNLGNSDQGSELAFPKKLPSGSGGFLPLPAPSSPPQSPAASFLVPWCPAAHGGSHGIQAD